MQYSELRCRILNNEPGKSVEIKSKDVSLLTQICFLTGGQREERVGSATYDSLVQIITASG